MNSQIDTTLHQLGLTKNQRAVYVAILKTGETDIATITRQTKIHRRNIYDTLQTLLDRGLVYKIIGDHKDVYGAAKPRKLLELVEAKEQTLHHIMPQLQQLYKTPTVEEHAVIYKGIEGFRQYMTDIITKGEDVYCLGAKGGWLYKELGDDFRSWFEKEYTRKKITTYDFFDTEMEAVLKDSDRLKNYKKYGPYKFLPPEYSTNAAVDIFADRVVTFTGLSLEKLEDDVTLFVIISQDIADSWRTWFQFLWDSTK
jgi:sugar-specific transcriptional regulator TrmB